MRSLVVSGIYLFGGTTDGAFLSTDNGANWTQVKSGSTNLAVNSIELDQCITFFKPFRGATVSCLLRGVIIDSLVAKP